MERNRYGGAFSLRSDRSDCIWRALAIAAKHSGSASAVSRRGFPVSVKRLELFKRQRLADQIALDLIAMVFAQERQLLWGFHALGDHQQVEAVSQLDDGSGDGRVLWVAGHFADECDVDFKLVDREAAQVRQA